MGFKHSLIDMFCHLERKNEKEQNSHMVTTNELVDMIKRNLVCTSTIKHPAAPTMWAWLT